MKPAGAVAQQNASGTAREDEAFVVGGALHGYVVDQGEIAEASTWDISLTDWRKLREQTLLDKSKLLSTKATAVSSTIGSPGHDYGIHALRMSNFDSLVTAYDGEIGKPGAFAGDRKAMTARAPALARQLRSKMRSMDRLVPQFRTTAEGSAFVDGWFASGSIDDLGHGPAAPTPPTPPTP